MLGLSVPASALVFLVLVSPICAWVAWSDLKTMKIPNAAVLSLLGVYLLAGPLLLPLDVWAWRWLHFALVLVAGIILNAVAHFGAGDAKFAAAMAPFFAQAHLNLVLILLAAFLLGAFVAHRLVRRVPALRGLAPDWVSWSRADFPLGLALVGTLCGYLAIVALTA
ncbi:MAG: prepilin peptidase [Phaeovulum sp.]|uniref:prepilin peptidase n=1 Tax=Phaeovulum sp. TaxID=2934796 RepID=UPI00272FD2D7|nr:prepilin peptidase [Phaeovulum sp.]MDP2064098.1 prepilin peptidase [Phaeovulum sp.]MDP3862530.1 prepilin peptidase [Phaeovulum sp.]